MYCIIDIGSNTIRLVIYRVENGLIRPILNNKSTAGLAGYVDKKNCLTREGIVRLISVLREFAGVMSLLPDCPVYPFATASLRNIANTSQVLETVWRETGLGIQVLSGQEEALLDYRGAIRRAAMDTGLLVDVGGGSTELVYFRDRTVLAAHSMPVGSLNLYRRFVNGILPGKKELRAMREEVRQALKDVIPRSDCAAATPLCGVGGTARAAMALHAHWEKSPEHQEQYDTAFFSRVLHHAEKQPHKLMRDILKTAPERVHTLTPGILVLHTIAEFYRCPLIQTSPYGVREGYLSFILEKEGIPCD